MRAVIASIEGEYLRYKELAEGSFRQLSVEQLAQAAGDSDNSAATIAWHVGGNLKSRFTDFLDSDGEKPWRDRETEFRSRQVTHAELSAFWGQGWQALQAALAALTDSDLTHRKDPQPAALRLGSPSPFTSTHQLSRGADRFHCQEVERPEMGIFEHSPGQVRGV
ncbi:MAG: DUF1572 family protein [Terriglobia bacterium]|jgi:hypothetical protein